MNKNQDISLLQYQVLSTFVQQPHLFVHYAEKLREDYFTETFFKQLIKAMLQVNNNLGALDKYLIRDFLIKEVKHPDLSWLEAMEYEILELSNLDDCIETLKNQFIRRLFHELGMNLLQNSFESSIQIPELKNTVQNYLTRFDEAMPAGNTESLRDILKRIHEPQPSTSGLTWFEKSLHSYLGNLEMGELVVIGGRPGMGKTAFLHTQLVHLASNKDTSVGYINLIENERNLVAKLLKVSGTALVGKDVTEMQIMEEQPWPIYLCNRLPNNQIDELIVAAKNLKYKYDIKVLAIDCFQQITYKAKSSYRDYELGLVLQRLKHLARELNVAILLTSHISRAAERRGYLATPLLADLKETSYLEEVADKVLFLYRYAYYGILDYGNGKLTGDDSKVIIAKNKEGMVGEVELLFDSNQGRFMPREKEIPFVFEFPANRLVDLE
jgi:replicative DNA helicase